MNNNTVNMILLAVVALLSQCVGLPWMSEEKRKDEIFLTRILDMEYYRYLSQIFKDIEHDPVFIRAVANVTEEDLRSGNVINLLKIPKEEIRTRLNGIKRKEVEYQVYLARSKSKKTIEEEELGKLQAKHRALREGIETKRKETFKEYQMDKEYRRRRKMDAMNEKDREVFQTTYEKERNREHAKINGPGSKSQFIEAWVKLHDLDKDTFDEKTLFNLHDKSGDSYLDFFEVETLFLYEIGKVYSEALQGSDPVEREEELKLMTENLISMLDKDTDSFISLVEFLERKNDEDYELEMEWKPIPEEEQFGSDEMETYEKAKLAEEKEKNSPMSTIKVKYEKYEGTADDEIEQRKRDDPLKI